MRFTRDVPHCVALCLAFLASCSVDLAVPNNATIECNGDNECPDGYLCSAGVCDAVLVNVAPQVTVRSTGRGASALPLELVVVDANGNNSRTETVTLALSSVIDGTRCPLTTIDASLQDLNATRSGVTYTLHWNAIADASPACGITLRDIDRDGDGSADGQTVTRVADVTIEVVATDASGARSSTATTTLELGNDAPAVGLEPVPSDVTNDVALAFAITDTSLDATDVRLQFALPGSPFRDARIKFGATSNLLSDGTQQVLVWDSADATGGIGTLTVNDVVLRIVAGDNVDGADYGAADEVTVNVVNQSAPTVEGLTLLGDAFGRASSIAYVNYRLVDAQSDPVDVRVEASVNHGPFIACSELPTELHSGRYALTSAPATADINGVLHTFVWDVAADARIRGAESVVLRVTPADPRGGVGRSTSIEVGSQIGLAQDYAGSGGYKIVAQLPASLQNRVLLGDLNGGGTDAVTGGSSFPLLVFSGDGTTLVGPASFGSGMTDTRRGHVLGDLNGDAFADVAITNDSDVRIYYGGPAGPTLQQTLTGAGCDTHATKLAIGDFDNDGQNEVAMPCGANARLIRRSGASWIVDPTSYPTTSAPNFYVSRLAAGDVTGDGVDDLVVDVASIAPSTTTYRLVLLPGVTTGATFGTPQVIADALPFVITNDVSFNEQGLDVAIADYDNDGTGDIIALGAPFQTSGQLFVYRGGHLGDPPLLSDVMPTRPHHLALADVDGNGALDVLTFACGGSGSPCMVAHALREGVVARVGSATFGDAAEGCGAGVRYSGDAADLDGDGRAEIVLAMTCGTTRLVAYSGQSGFTPTALVDRSTLAQVTNDSDELSVLDYDHDGALDLIVSDYGLLVGQVRNGGHAFPAVRPLLGTLAAGTIGDSFDNTSIYRALPGDFDGDGLADFFVSNRTYYLSLLTRSQQIDATTYAFRDVAPVAYTGQDPDRVLAVADLDRDGFDDMIGRYDTSLIVARGGAGGMTVSANLDLGYTPAHVAVGDYDQDGRLDIAMANVGTSLTLLRGNGGGTFTAMCTRAAATTIRGIAIADTLEDGFRDVVIAEDASGGGTTLQALRMTGIGCPAAVTDPAVTKSPEALTRLTSLDFDGDGINDIVGFGNGPVVVWLTASVNGLGTFAFTPPVTIASGLKRAEVVDFDRDGAADVVGITSGTAAVIAHGLQQAFSPRGRVATWVTPESRTGDAFGEPIVRSIEAHLFDGFGRYGEPPVVDFVTEAAARGIVASDKRALTRAYTVGGFSSIARDDAADRYRVVSETREVIVDVPIIRGRYGVNVGSGIVLAARLDGFVTDADGVLPQGPALERSSTWTTIPRDADGDLATGSGRRFVVENSSANHRVRVVLDGPGVVQAFYP